ncbi:ribonuclease R family protein [Collinsella intestinalis]|uniref:ribonuclease R family protein n=1 Tax=Collinsella intestinalis TaxID=147207 RepID=UPI00195A565A|nr:RNB domain-containing ribonuclease [Collinsella intestinalis]MBM6683247.1 RNB domain-containing ribonuclease [Collinsella intestinalis]
MGRKRRSGHRGPTRGVRRPSLTGTVVLREHGALVETAEGSFRLAGRSLREVMSGDTVAVSLHRAERGERRAVVEGVLERAATTVVGTYAPAGPLGAVRPLDSRLKADFFVLPSDVSAQDLGVGEGDVVLARIVSYPTRYESGVVTLERRLGGADAPDLGIQCIMARYDLAEGYPETAEREAAELSLDVAEALADPLRRDLRDRFVLTIDPVDARDFDDAISLARTPEGGYRLGVHIADVSHYVAWESSIDLEARRRGTSVYLADRVLPMLPERLSNGLCSLVPNEDRLAFTVDMELDAAGRVRSATMIPSVIRSRVRLSYDQADALLGGVTAVRDGGAELGGDDATGGARASADGAPGAAPASPSLLPETPVGGAPLAEQVARAAGEGVDLAAFLAAADELAQKRVALRYTRGAVDFDTVEVHALLDDAGVPIALTSRERTRATGLIEEAMLLANECVAQRLAALDRPCAYRVHESPSPDHLHAAASALSELGIATHREALKIELGDQAAMREVLERVAGTGEAEIANALLLRAMQRAVYKPVNEGHYALGAPAYCHFTSPIRRYPDLIVHRVLKQVLAEERLGKRAARERAPRLVGTGREALDRILPGLCRSASEHERVADAAAHASQKVKVAQFYATRVGERATGRVVWMDQLGLFVRLDDTRAEGLVHLSAVGDEWFDLDECTLTLTGASTGRTVRVGDAVIVEVAGVNVLRGHLDLRLVHRMGTLH